MSSPCGYMLQAYGGDFRVIGGDGLGTGDNATSCSGRLFQLSLEVPPPLMFPMTVTPLGRDQDCSLKIREPEVPALFGSWILEVGTRPPRLACTSSSLESVPCPLTMVMEDTKTRAVRLKHHKANCLNNIKLSGHNSGDRKSRRREEQSRFL
ncbi:hypothetical protein STEG23_022779 [Scotinomys teguina]